jgi:hypothetical protein
VILWVYREKARGFSQAMNLQPLPFGLFESGAVPINNKSEV